MKAAEIVVAISRLRRPDDVARVMNAVRARYKGMQRRAARRFSVGDTVEFEARGIRYEGTVARVNRVTISVTIGAGLGRRKWRVSPSLCRRIVQKEETA